MSRDKKILYTVSLVIFAALLSMMFVSFESVEGTRIATAILLIPLAVATRLLIKKRSSTSIYKREVLLLITVVSAIILVLLHMSGIYFGYYKNPYFVKTASILLTHVLPLTCIIITTELIRSTILAQKNPVASIIAFLSCVLAEVLMVHGVPAIISFNRFMDVVGLALLPAISANIFYHYSAKRFGMIPNMIYRAIMTLYVYFIPTEPAISDALMSCIKMILPILMLALLASMYEKKMKKARKQGKRLGAISVILTTVIIVSVTALISCQFRFGALVIATESMTGEINKGDMIIYERYEGQAIKEGQVIVFTDGPSKIVHRVVEIEYFGNETRYYTKGDANPNLDVGYRTDADVFGLTDLKISMIGYPTLWLRELIKN